MKKSKNIKLSSGYAFGANDNGKNFQQLFEPQNFSKLENISLLGEGAKKKHKKN